jgi:intracellular sulfur oxidation DsrE/DsrF family protein
MSSKRPDARRTFLSSLAAGLVLGATAGERANAQSPQSGSAAWQPARHAQDDWLDRLNGVHRFVIDTTTPAGFDAALLFANNYFTANRDGYGLTDGDLAVVLVARHDSTPFAYNDAMWAKYGASLTRRSGFLDPGTKQPPTTNIYRSRLDQLIKRGVHLAVCEMATRFLARTIAGASGADSAYAELTSNLAANAHMVPAGIVAVNRAQERGYSLAHAV